MYLAAILLIVNTPIFVLNSELAFKIFVILKFKFEILSQDKFQTVNHLFKDDMYIVFNL